MSDKDQRIAELERQVVEAELQCQSFANRLHDAEAREAVLREALRNLADECWKCNTDDTDFDEFDGRVLDAAERALEATEQTPQPQQQVQS